MRHFDKIINFTGNSRIPSKFLVFKSASLIEPLLWQKVAVPDGLDALQLDNDIALLFNQQRLASLGTDNVKAFTAELDKQMSTAPELASIRKKVSDEDLLRFCKSRYIQSPSELMAWTDYLSSNVEKLSDDLAKQVAQAIIDDEQNKKTPENVTSSEPPKAE